MLKMFFFFAKNKIKTIRQICFLYLRNYKIIQELLEKKNSRNFVNGNYIRKTIK